MSARALAPSAWVIVTVVGVAVADLPHAVKILQILNDLSRLGVWFVM
jgi:hypothetical protein